MKRVFVKLSKWSGNILSALVFIGFCFNAHPAWSETVKSVEEAYGKLNQLERQTKKDLEDYHLWLELGRITQNKGTLNRQEHRRILLEKAREGGLEPVGVPRLARKAGKIQERLERAKMRLYQQNQEVTSLQELCYLELQSEDISHTSEEEETGYLLDDDSSLKHRCVDSTNQWLSSHIVRESSALEKIKSAESPNISLRDKEVLEKYYGISDLNLLSCADFVRIYKRESLGVTSIVGGLLIPGIPQLLRKEWLKGAAYIGTVAAATASAQISANPSLAVLAHGMLGGLSIYDAYISNPFHDPRLFGEKKRKISELLISPARLDFLKSSKVYKTFPLYTAAGLGLQAFAGGIIGELSTPGNAEDIKEMSNEVMGGSIVYKLLSAAGISYAAAIGEEALFRGMILPAIQERMLRRQLITQDDIENNQCALLTTSRMMDRLESLPKEDQDQIRASAHNWSNVTQALIFGAAHGNPLAPFHNISGLAFGKMVGNEPHDVGSIDQGAFAHFWWDFIMLSHLFLGEADAT